MLLMSVEEVRNRITFDMSGDVDAAILGALRSATQSLKSQIRTPFERSIREDFFRVERTNMVGTAGIFAAPSQRAHQTLEITGSSPLFHIKLRTEQGFIDEFETSGYEVFAASLQQHLGDPSLRRDIRNFEDGLDHTYVDFEKGLVFIDGLVLNSMFVVVRYTAGFFETSDEVAEGIPDWLAEAAYLSTVISLTANPVMTREGDISRELEETRRQLRFIMDDHMRYEPAAVKTLRSRIL